MTGWFCVFVSDPGSLEVSRTAVELRCSTTEALGWLVRLWTWALVQAPDGNTARWGESLGAAVGWPGDSSSFRAALAASGVLSPEGDIVGWSDRYKLRRQAERQARIRSKARGATVASPSHDSSALEEKRREKKKTPLPPSRGDGRVPVVEAVAEPELPLVEPELPLVEPDPEPDELVVDDHAPELDRLAQLDAQAPASASRQRWLVAVVAAWNLGAGQSGVARAQAPSPATAKRDEVMLRWRKTFPRPSSWGAMARALARSDHHRGATTGWRADLGWAVERGRGQKLERFMAEGAELLALAEASGTLPPAIEGPAVERAAKVSAKASAFDQARALAAPSSGTLRYRDTSAPYRRAAVDEAALFVDGVLSSAELAPIDPLEVAP